MSNTQLQSAVDREASNLRRHLKNVASQALAAIARMDEGMLPSPYGDSEIFNHDLERALQNAARLDALVSILHTEEDTEKLKKSLKGEGIY